MTNLPRFLRIFFTTKGTKDREFLSASRFVLRGEIFPDTTHVGEFRAIDRPSRGAPRRARHHAGRKGLLGEGTGNIRLARTVRTIGLGVGIPCGFVFAITIGDVDPFLPTPLGLVNGIAFGIGGPVLGLGYAAAIGLMVRTRWGLNFLAPFAGVGRMALSHYLMQSVMCTTFFRAVGWYGQVGPARGLTIVAVVGAFQLWISGWWFRRFRFGPVEWLWRGVTYGALPRFSVISAG